MSFNEWRIIAARSNVPTTCAAHGDTCLAIRLHPVIQESGCHLIPTFLSSFMSPNEIAGCRHLKPCEDILPPRGQACWTPLPWISGVPLQHVRSSATCRLPGGPGQDEREGLRLRAWSGCFLKVPGALPPAVLKVCCRRLSTRKKQAKFTLGSSLTSRLAFAKELKQTEGDLLPFNCIINDRSCACAHMYFVD